MQYCQIYSFVFQTKNSNDILTYHHILLSFSLILCTVDHGTDEIPQALQLIANGAGHTLLLNGQTAVHKRVIISSMFRLVVGYLFLSSLFITISQNNNVIEIFYDVLVSMAQAKMFYSFVFVTSLCSNSHFLLCKGFGIC